MSEQLLKLEGENCGQRVALTRCELQLEGGSKLKATLLRRSQGINTLSLFSLPPVSFQGSPLVKPNWEQQVGKVAVDAVHTGQPPGGGA